MFHAARNLQGEGVDVAVYMNFLQFHLSYFAKKKQFLLHSGRSVPKIPPTPKSTEDILMTESLK